MQEAGGGFVSNPYLELMDLVLFGVPSGVFDPAPDYQLSEREAGH